MSSGKFGNGCRMVENIRGACRQCHINVAPFDPSAAQRDGGWVHGNCLQDYDHHQSNQSVISVEAPFRREAIAKKPEELVAAFQRL